MTDMLIRDVPDDIIAGLDAQARQQGLSRTEYVRRLFVQDVGRRTGTCTMEDLRRFSETFADARDPEIMRRAWE